VASQCDLLFLPIDNTNLGCSGGQEGGDILREEKGSDSREITWECGVDAAPCSE